MNTNHLVAGLLAVSVFAAGMPVASHAAEVCYRDEAGRIVARRRPGVVEVPCPSSDTTSEMPAGVPGEMPPEMPAEMPAETPSEAPVEVPADRSTGASQRPPAPRRPMSEVEPPAYVSPLPRPRIADYVDSVPLPDRWRIVEALGYRERWWDPYNRNVLKADRPVRSDWFFNLGLISDTFYEVRDVPTPVGGSSSAESGAVDIFGSADQQSLNQNLALELVYYKGDTVFKPPDYEFRLTPVLSYNRLELDEVQAANVDPRAGVTRSSTHVGLQAAFVDKHLRNVSDRYDFDSVRIGIQPFSTDFRGFLFQDNQLGARLFGTRANNRVQYNLAWFRRLEKDTNSGLNDLAEDLRDDDVFVANLYWQDVPVKGFTSQGTVAYNRNREDREPHFNSNGFLERPAVLGRDVPRRYDVVYVGYNGDGHFGRLNLTSSVYYAFGEEEPGAFVAAPVDIGALFAALEMSVDFDWLRTRLSLLYASGDDDPFDDRASGFDAIFENPQFAGADTSYWIRQAVPLIGGGRVVLSSRNGVLNSLRSSKEEGQANFTNPGLMLAGLGADMDLLPTLRLSFNANTLYFAETSVVEVARSQAGIDRHIGYDLSAALIWRPLMSQNIVVRASYATLLAGDGFDALFPDEDPGYFLLNAVLAY